MSDLRIALVAEGPTDAVVIEAALRATLDRPFVLTLLQPEATRWQIGTGWCGVFKWCREFAERPAVSLETDPTLPGFDLFVIHVDADVADAKYGDCGLAVEQAARELAGLPCSKPCPPPQAAADAVRERLESWLGMIAVGPRTVLCVPSKAIDAWLAAAVLPADHGLRSELECQADLASRLAVLPKSQKIRKTRRDFEARSGVLVAQWQRVRIQCTQAERFSREIADCLS
jgi:hypothetical protein